MPEPASSRSLEDILASIRRSLADETVDGLVELSSAAVDAARAEQSRAAALQEHAGADAQRSAADALADDLLRDKLAGALVLDTDTGEAELSEADAAALEEAASDATAPPPDASESDRAEPEFESAALANLWVLRPGIEQAKPAGGTMQSLTLDPFAGARAAPGETKPAAEFSLSPLELLGGTKPLDKPVAAMPPLPKATASLPHAAPASNGAGPPRLDSESIALLQKLRASNAAAIEKIAQSNVEAEEAQAPEPEVAEPEPDVSDAAEDLLAEAPPPEHEEPAPAADPVVAAEPVVAFPFAEPAPDPVPAAKEEARPLLSLPERSTPLFGGHEDARPQLTSGLEHLLPEAGAVPLEVEDVVADVVVPELGEPAEAPPALALDPVAEIVAEPAPATASLGLAEAEPAIEAMAEPEGPVATPAEDIPEAPQSAVPGGNKALEDMIAAVLEPVLQRLIETSIGPALEVLVRREVERALKEQRPPE